MGCVGHATGNVAESVTGHGLKQGADFREDIFCAVGKVGNGEIVAKGIVAQGVLDGFGEKGAVLLGEDSRQTLFFEIAGVFDLVAASLPL